MTPRVLFDLQVFVEQARGGVSRYFRELGKALSIRRVWEPVLSPGLHVTADGMDIPAAGAVVRVPSVNRGFRLMRATNLMISKATSPWLSKRIALVHPTWYHRPSIEVWEGKPVVLTIHDLIPESWPAVTTPEQLADRAWAIGRADAILCVSHTTRRDLVELFPEAADKSVVAYPGIHPLPLPSRHDPLNEPYFVYVGKRGAYKDFGTLLRALAVTRFRLVVVGGGAPGEATLRHIGQSGLDKLITFETAPDDATLASILAGATALISTSRQEGFGMPPLEALALGTPVILSDIDVYREVYGDWAAFFLPGNEEALAAAMETVANSPPATPGLTELSGRFSWNETAARAEHAYGIAVG